MSLERNEFRILSISAIFDSKTKWPRIQGGILTYRSMEIVENMGCEIANSGDFTVKYNLCGVHVK